MPFQSCHHAGVQPSLKSRSTAEATARIFGARAVIAAQYGAGVPSSAALVNPLLPRPATGLGRPATAIRSAGFEPLASQQSRDVGAWAADRRRVRAGRACRHEGHVAL